MQSATETPNCCICLAQMNAASEQLTRLSCAHTMHTECWTRWQERKHTCPMCRANVAVWANYAIVGEAERSLQAVQTREVHQSSARDWTQLLILDNSGAAGAYNWPITNPSPIYEPKFTFAVRALYFAVRNKTFANEWSNYTTAQPYNNGTVVTFTPSGADAPIDTITHNYEGTTPGNTPE